MHASPLSQVKTYLKTHQKATAGELRAELGLGQLELEEVLEYLTQTGRLKALKAVGGLEDPSEKQNCEKTTGGGCSCGTTKPRGAGGGSLQTFSQPQTQVFFWKEPLPKR